MYYTKLWLSSRMQSLNPFTWLLQPPLAVNFENPKYGFSTILHHSCCATSPHTFKTNGRPENVIKSPTQFEQLLYISTDS